MLPLGDRDECRHIGELLRLVLLRLDVGELKQLHPVQLPLRLAHFAAREDLARLEGELPANNVLGNALLALDFDGTEMREHARRRRERDPHLVSTGALLRDVDFRVRVALVAQRVERTLARGNGQLPIERLFHLEGKRVAEAPLLAWSQHIEAGEINAGDERRLPFREPDDDVDLVLRVIQLDVERADARVGESAIAIERLQPFEVGFERAAIEIGFVPPGQPGSALGLKRSGERLLVDLLDALEIEAVNLDVALLAAGTKKEGNEEEQKGKTRTCSGHGDGSSPHAMPEQYAESQP